jgi:hypothetical protein
MHDDDLARVQGDLQPDALMCHLQGSKPEIQYVQYGQYMPISQLSAGHSPNRLSFRKWKQCEEGQMLSGEFRAQHPPHQGALALRRVKVYNNHVEVKIDPGTVYHYDGMHLALP